MIGTPSEILEYIEKGSVVPAEIRYLVLDEADCMLGSGLGPKIHKTLRPLQDHHESKSSVKRLQTILEISTIAEVLGDKFFDSAVGICFNSEFLERKLTWKNGKD